MTLKEQQDVLHRVAPDGEFRESEGIVVFDRLVGDRVRAVHRVNLSWGPVSLSSGRLALRRTL